jgi:integrase
MASITTRNGRYLVRVRLDGFPTQTKTFTLKADGLKWARTVETSMESGKFMPGEAQRPSLQRTIALYRLGPAAKLKGAAVYVYRYDEFERLPFAGKPVDKVTSFDLAAYRDSQMELHKPGTVIRKLAMLSAIFNWAMKTKGWLDRNPASLVSRPRSNDRRERVLSGDEHRYLMDAAATSKATWLPAALTLSMNSAMRRGELFGLRRKDVRYEESVIHLAETKAGGSRLVPLGPRSIAALRDLDAAAPDGPDAPLLPVGEAGSISTRFAVTLRRARRNYDDDCLVAGTLPAPGFLADLRWHDMRHHAITAVCADGNLTLAEVMAISGHRTAAQAMRYSHVNVPRLAAKLALLQP